MKTLKKMMAFALAMVMVLSMSMTVFAGEGGTGDGGTTPVAATGEGSITVNSPVIGAKYAAYQIFDMTANEDYDSFSYTISKDSPFYNAVVAYATAKETIKLTATNSDPNTFNVSVPEGKTLDAQDFGKEMMKAVNGSPAVPAVEDDPETPEDESKPAVDAVPGNGATPIYPETLGNNPVTVDETDYIKFTGLDLGYYLINATYPTASATVKIPGTTVEFTNADTEDDIDDKIETYVNETVTPQYVKDYVDAGDFERTLPSGEKEKITSANITAAELDDFTDQLKTTLTTDTKDKVTAALANAQAGSESDINVKEPILVFVDSTTPNATINEKNEIPKWDIPVNPEGYADIEGLPDHGEPSGGKNIVVGEDANGNSIYADWSEANIGDSVHYQLRINAMNFVRESDNSDSEINQAKEYFIADFQNPNMHYDSDKGIKVTIVNHDGTNVTSNIGNADRYKTAEDGSHYLDYSDANAKFFTNGEETTASATDPFGDGTGIMIPFVFVEKAGENYTPNADHPIYTVNKVPVGDGYQKWDGHTAGHEGEVADANGNVPKHDDDGFLLDKNNKKIPVTDDYYVYSIYNSDVTIVVDYYMILDNTAVVDNPGNKNYARYAYTPVEKDENGEPTVVPKNPDEDEDEPSKKKEVDDATVYTYALAVQKVDENGNTLAGAKFKFKGLTVTEKAPGYYKVKKYDPEGDFDSADEVEMDANGLLVIEGLMTSETLTLQETEAPDGYNKLEGTKDVNATKLGKTVTTTSSTTYYDKDGNEVRKDEEYTKTETIITTIEELKAAAIEVINKQGAELPSTGGIGTTIFYILGAILVLGAGILLVTRRRMNTQ